jgi:hypothetical protein
MNADGSPIGEMAGPAVAPAFPTSDRHPARKKRRPALLYRFPKLFWSPPIDQEWEDDWPVVRDQDVVDYPQLAGDLTVWLKVLKPRFMRLDHRAQILQNQFWRQNVTLIAGGLVATSLGAVQAGLGGGVAGIAVAQAVITGGLAGLAVLIRSRRAQQGYLTARLKAERIKSEFFVFLARAGDYAGPDRLTALLQQVDDIEAAEGTR